ncbi:MAG: hypothetical protein KC983_02395 [Phycisphaerales bacterium]|nr:hypothetical protein [Phycisphaerales bacterium]
MPEVSTLHIYLGTIGMMLTVAVIVHLGLMVSGPAGGFSRWVMRAPGLDILVLLYTALPHVAGPLLGGWAGLGAAIGGQVTAVLLWCIGHELLNRKQVRGKPRIHSTLRKLVGGWRNHFAVWWTALAVPLFWLVRLAELIVYPPLTWSVRLPKYVQGDWVNVSRHKFEGLIGYDLIWCLYCDWMTGVWSQGTDMLRNVESFWCPIRFADSAKCANCKIDFPDIENGWIAADGSMDDVAELLTEKYGKDVNAWFGHPIRLTVGETDTKHETS